MLGPIQKTIQFVIGTTVAPSQHRSLKRSDPVHPMSGVGPNQFMSSLAWQAPSPRVESPWAVEIRFEDVAV
jgi:hypothetical protein